MAVLSLGQRTAAGMWPPPRAYGWAARTAGPRLRLDREAELLGGLIAERVRYFHRDVNVPALVGVPANWLSLSVGAAVDFSARPGGRLPETTDQV